MYYIYLAWYFKWTNWTEADYNTWLGCKPGYYLQFAQCKEACEGRYFANALTQTWEACHSYWSQWKDSTQFNWQQWVSGDFYFNNGWYETWPDGYYGDKTTYTCQLWNIGWTKWFGPSLKECIEWNNALLYIKSGATECSIATCCSPENPAPPAPEGAGLFDKKNFDPPPYFTHITLTILY